MLISPSKFSLFFRNGHFSLGAHVCDHSDGNRVATVREKVLENEKKIQVREKSGNYIFSQGNFKKMKKVMEKSGNFKIFLKRW